MVLMCLLVAVARASEPPLQLARVYQAGMDLQGYWVSEKLDGVRAYWDGQQLLSRGGNIIAAPDWFLRDFPAQPLDGELWMGRGRFAQVSAAVRRLQPKAEEWRKIRFMVFDLPSSDMPFSERVEKMRELVEKTASYHLAMVEQRRATDHGALLARLDRVMAIGGEGLMLHHGDSVYKAGRTAALLKVKTFQDAEATVVDYSDGKGKYQGQVGALVVETGDGRRFKLGSGLSDNERADPPPVGSTVTYKFFGLTANGLPRFASFLRIRNDQPPAWSRNVSQFD
ncbi:DNA ligase [Alcanivorax jadensis T9]|jgi:DNA ligase-1|uniref:DNA ligase n=2 Tax=Alcanivorax jadensis TaxID=64988 RepID=A0ABR4WF74_9GAMM|nr:DNA ligase [Alcanivorax jadensis T9]MBP22929.1 DNA ligase [Alcanivorax sp.]